DAAPEALQVLPQSAHPREVVLELRELDLELALGADRVLGEDVEDQLRAVDDARLEDVLGAALLDGRQLVVDDQGLGRRVLEGVLELRQLALADVRARVGPLAMLHELADRLHARPAGRLAQLGDLRAGVDAFRGRCEHEPTLGLRTRRWIRLAGRHAGIMPLRSEDSMRRTASSSSSSGTVSEGREKPSPPGPQAGPGRDS